MDNNQNNTPETANAAQQPAAPVQPQVDAPATSVENAVQQPVENVPQEQPAAPVQPQVEAPAAPVENTVQQPVQSVPQGQPVQQMNNVYQGQPVYNNVQPNSEAESGKAMGILSYIGFLALIPYFAEKNNRFVIYHAKQGMNLLLIEVAASVLLSIIYWILPWEFFTVIRIISAVVSLAAIAMSVVGIVNVCNAKTVELPLIGKLNIIK